MVASGDQSKLLEGQFWSLAELVAWIMARDWQALASINPIDTPDIEDDDGSEIIELQHRRAYFAQDDTTDSVPEEIMRACRGGRLQTFGRYNSSQGHIEILPSDWLDLYVVLGTKRSDDIAVEVPFDPYSPRPYWEDLRFSKADALALWPGPQEPETEARSKSTIADETKCKNWLIGLMAEEEPSQNKDYHFAEAQQKFGVSRRGFDRAWANAIDITGNKDWSKPGRRS